METALLDAGLQEWVAPRRGRIEWVPQTLLYFSQHEPFASVRIAEQSGESAEAHLKDIAQAIESSRRLLSWEKNWDGEGSPPYRNDTWERAVTFLTRHAKHLWEHYQVILDAPRIEPGPEGSIDIHWKTEHYELLIEVPADPTKRATFYGDDKGNIFIEGTLNVSSFSHGLIAWLLDART